VKLKTGFGLSVGFLRFGIELVGFIFLYEIKNYTCCQKIIDVWRYFVDINLDSVQFTLIWELSVKFVLTCKWMSSSHHCSLVSCTVILAYLGPGT